MTNSGKGFFYSGTSNVVLPVPNKQFFPQEFRDKTRLTYYASLFNSVEVNSSFYKVPRGITVEKWSLSVPDNFRFTFKLWREITHNKVLSFPDEAVTRFMSCIGHAKDKEGCLLVQFPPALTIDFPGLARLLSLISHSDPWKKWNVAVEFRNRSWYQEDIYHLLDEHQAAIVLHDMPASAPGLADINSHIVYLRFHGPEGNYRGTYTDAFLYEYAGYIKEWLTEGKTVYCYFNNTMGDAVRNLEILNHYVS